MWRYYLNRNLPLQNPFKVLKFSLLHLFLVDVVSCCYYASEIQIHIRKLIFNQWIESIFSLNKLHKNKFFLLRKKKLAAFTKSTRKNYTKKYFCEVKIVNLLLHFVTRKKKLFLKFSTNAFQIKIIVLT